MWADISGLLPQLELRANVAFGRPRDNNLTVPELGVQTTEFLPLVVQMQVRQSATPLQIVRKKTLRQAPPERVERGGPAALSACRPRSHGALGAGSLGGYHRRKGSTRLLAPRAPLSSRSATSRNLLPLPS
jgi:hypothetical protein